MKAKDLAELLMKNPEQEVWFSDDVDTSEGGIPVYDIKNVYASSAGLDGDQLDDEYFYIEDMTREEIDQKIAKGYYYDPDNLDCISKKITLLTSS